MSRTSIATLRIVPTAHPLAIVEIVEDAAVVPAAVVVVLVADVAGVVVAVVVLAAVATAGTVVMVAADAISQTPARAGELLNDQGCEQSRPFSVSG